MCALLFNIPLMTAFQFDSEKWCFYPTWDTSPNNWFIIYVIARLVFFNGLVLVLATVFQFLLVKILHKKIERKRTLSTAMTRKSSEYQLSMALIVSVIFCIIVEVLALLFSPITIALFWEKNVDDRTRGVMMRSVMPLNSLEYTMTVAFSLYFNLSFRQFFTHPCQPHLRTSPTDPGRFC